MKLKINFKQGLRRIVLSLLGFCACIALCIYITCGFTFHRYEYADNMKLTSVKTNKTINLEEYIRIYASDDGKYIGSWNIECHPYKQYCVYDDWKYKRNQKIEITLPDEKVELNITALNPFQYFLGQLWDFVKIFLIAGLVFGIYLVLEFVFCWIIAGFKDKEQG